ncbi:MAG: LD-carboxypeptidase [Maricaulaceae bacterium]
MSGKTLKIGVVAPSRAIEPNIADAARARAETLFPANAPEIVFHPQCFAASGHFAGEDATRLAGFLDFANDPSFDAVWFARGGYGACRIAEAAAAALEPAAREKAYLGYSDAGALMAALYGAGCTRVAHGPMPYDIRRKGGEAAVDRALKFLVDGDRSGLEPSTTDGQPTAAFNIITFSHVIGTPMQPDLTSHVVMLEEVSEYLYRIDRALCQITSNRGFRKVAGVRLGRCSDVPENDIDFGMTEEEVVRHWCEAAAIPYLGRADIGHDADNKIVPFGLWRG